jgi:hypothetical protein
MEVKAGESRPSRKRQLAVNQYLVPMFCPLINFETMMAFPQRLTIDRSISPIPCFRNPWVSMSVSSRHHLSTSPPALHEEFFQNTSRRWI